MKAPEIMRGERRLLETERDHLRAELKQMADARDCTSREASVYQEQLVVARAALDAARKRIAALEAGMSEVARWRGLCHAHDDDMGHPPRSFNDEDWDALEQFAQRLASAATEPEGEK